MNKFIYISILASALILCGCKKDKPGPEEPTPGPLALTQEHESQWALMDVKVSANKEVSEWKVEIAKGDFSPLVLPTDGPVITDDGVVTLPIFRKFDIVKKNPIVDYDVVVTATTVEGETAQCNITSKSWMPVLYSGSGDKMSEDELDYGTIFKVRVQYANESSSCLPADIFKEFAGFRYSDKAYNLIEYKEDYVKFEVLSGADDYTMTVGNDFFAWSLITEPANLPYL